MNTNPLDTPNDPEHAYWAHPDRLTELAIDAQLEAEEKTYEVVRFRFKGEKTIIKSGLTLEEAMEHCERPDTKGPDWFDGWRQE